MSHSVYVTNNPINDNRKNSLCLRKNVYPFSPPVTHLLSVRFRSVGQRLTAKLCPAKLSVA